MEEAFGVLTFPFPLSLADQINRAGRESKARGKPAGRNLIVVNPAVGFTLPSAGVTPAPSINRKVARSALLCSRVPGGGFRLLPRPLLYGRGGRAQTRPEVRVLGLNLHTRNFDQASRLKIRSTIAVTREVARATAISSPLCDITLNSGPFGGT